MTVSRSSAPPPRAASSRIVSTWARVCTCMSTSGSTAGDSIRSKPSQPRSLHSRWMALIRAGCSG